MADVGEPTSTGPAVGSGSAIVERLITLASALGAGDLRQDAIGLRERVTEGRFYLACVGQFKRGKSTLLNALVGEPVLPTGIVPITTVATVLRFGPTSRARVRIRDAGWREIPVEELDRFVSEEHNPANVKRVDAAEVFVPSNLLASGMSLVDTPGIGSVSESSTAATQAFVPHIDAAIAVVGVDPPLSGDELTLVERIARQIQHLLVVLNKADRHSAAERAQGVAFAQRVLDGRLRHGVRVLEVSATNALAQREPRYDWDALVAALRRIEATSGISLVQSALRRGAVRIGSAIRQEVAERRAALTRPLEESERRLAALRELGSDAARSARQLGAVLGAEEAAVVATFERRRAESRGSIETPAVARLHEAIERLATDGVRGPRLRARAMEAARGIAEDALRPWLVTQASEAETLYLEVAQRFVALANEFLDRLVASGPEVLRGAGALPARVDRETSLQARSQFHFTAMMHLGAPVAPGDWTLDLVLPRAPQRRRVSRDAVRYLRRLLDVNTSRVEGDLRDRVRESRRGLEGDIVRVLRRVREAAERALDAARSAQAAGDAGARSALDRLTALDLEIEALARDAAHEGLLA